MTEHNPAHDSVIMIAGEEIRVHRSFDLIRRVEEKFGAITNLIANLRVQNSTVDELLWLLEQMLKDGQNVKLSKAELISHIEMVGVGDVINDVNKVILHLFVGNIKAREFIEQDEEKDKEEDEEDPLQLAS